MDMDIPRHKNYPPGAVQCDGCGGHGCEVCESKGWLPAGHPRGRTCHNESCNKPIPPNEPILYCSNKCAFEDA